MERLNKGRKKHRNKEKKKVSVTEKSPECARESVKTVRESVATPDTVIAIDSPKLTSSPTGSNGSLIKKQKKIFSDVIVAVGKYSNGPRVGGLFRTKDEAKALAKKLWEVYCFLILIEILMFSLFRDMDQQTWFLKH